MKTLITVDLDYWTNCYKRTNKEGIKLLQEIRKACDKSYLIWHHQDILDIIPPRTERIINIDFHNDIVGEDISDIDEDLNEGTWGNYLPRSVKLFEWFYPSEKWCIQKRGGLCLDGSGEVSTNYPVEYRQKRSWKNMNFSGGNCFVLCVSPEWSFCHEYTEYLWCLNLDDDENMINKKF
jgi:hypothetical protein